MLLTLIALLVGAAGGWLFYRYIGCKQGSCPMWANPSSSMLYGALLAVLFSNTFVTAQSGNGIQNVNAATFEAKLKDKNVVVLDVRTPGEYSTGHLPNAILLNINDPEFGAKIKKLDKNKEYLIYCRSGARSMRAATEMKNVGFTKLVNLNGGILSWTGKLVQ